MFIDGAISLNGDEGNTGEVLVSQGPGATPTWSNALSQFVPYTGATANVDLGNYNLIADNVQADIFQLNSGGILGLYGTVQLNGSPGTAGQVLTSSGGGVPTWTSLPNFSTFVPYTGATGNVDLGNNSLDADVINAGDVYANNLFNSVGNPSVFVGDDSITPVGLLINTSTKTFKLGDYNGNFNATNITIEDGSSRISFGGGFNLYNGQGTTGQVLESLGAGVTPQWTDVNALITSNLYKGNFYDSITQTLAAANTATPVILRNTDAPTTNGISIVTDGTNLSRITFANAGVYNILFSAQLANSGGTAQVVDFWIRKNGSTAAANIAHTNGKVQLQGNASFLMAAWNYFVDIAAGDYIQLVWSATSTNITMVAAAANALHPETPSIIVTANIV
jgi:hypothetical protein